MAKEEKIISEFSKMLKKMVKNTETNTEASSEMLALLKNEIKVLKKLADTAEDQFKAEKVAVFESQKAEKEFNEKMIEAEEKSSEISDEQLETLEDLFDIQKESNKKLEDIFGEIEEENKASRNDKKLESKKIANFSEGVSNFKDTASYLSELSGLNNIINFVPNLFSAIQSEFGTLGTVMSKLVISPLKGIGNFTAGIFKGLGSLVGIKTGGDGSPSESASRLIKSERGEEQREQTMGFQSESLGLLSAIALNTTPPDEMLKGKNPLDVLKGLIPKGFLGGSLKGLGSLGPKLWKMAGVGMILGGVFMGVMDFMEGFEEGGFGQGLYQAFVGKTDGSLTNMFKNAGKWGLIGAGIGTIAMPVVGTIIGGLIGMSIGFLVNYIGSLVKGPGNTGEKIGNFFLGGNGGVMSSLFNGSKYAAMGALVGTAIFPAVGTIAGGLIGFAIGFLINFVKQILPGDVKAGISRFVTSFGEHIYGAFTWLVNSVSSGFESFLNIWKGIINTGISLVKGGFELFSKAVDWIAEKLGITEYVTMIKEKVKTGWETVKTKAQEFVDFITNFGKNIWEKFKGIGTYVWERTKKWLGGGDEPGEIEAGVTMTSPQTKKPAGKKQSKKANKDTNSIVSSLFNTSGSSERTAKATEKEEEYSRQQKNSLHRILKQLRSISKFMENEMLKSFEEMFKDTANSITQTMKQIQEQNRQWAFAMETGSLQGYSGKVGEFSKELKKLERGTEKDYTGYKGAINSINNTNQNIINNLFPDDFGGNLRRGKE